MTDIFKTGFDNYVCTGESIEGESEGFTLTATIHDCNDTGAPWDNDCGHGPVSEWTSRAKLPGEMVLNRDGNSKRFYDYAEACRIARKDGWGMTRAVDPATLSPEACAVLLDAECRALESTETALAFATGRAAKRLERYAAIRRANVQHLADRAYGPVPASIDDISDE